MFARQSFLLRQLPAISRRLYSTPAPPPLLGKLRTDLKTSMRAKDTNRLNVLRTILAEVTNASKTDNPPSTDLHILAIIKKARNKSQTSAAEFAGAGREDLAAKENSQIEVLDEYMGQVETVGKDLIEAAVTRALEAAEKPNLGAVIQAVMAEFEGKPIIKSEIAQIAKELMAKK